MRTVAMLLALAGVVQAAPRAGELRKVGTLSFPISCAPPVRADFERAVALLHSFFYAEARRVFSTVAERDPKCAMAEWGKAMTLYHPIWAAPTEAELKEGRAAVEKANALGGGSAREKSWIRAITTFYTSTEAGDGKGGGVSCHGGALGGDHRGRALAYEKEMEKLAAEFPDDLEAKAFYALALLGTAPPTDKTLGNQLKAGAILEPLFIRYKDHPGISHYLIHAYDYPSTAPKGLPAARNYSQVAPWVPHALHMPGHIFTRLGLWEESIAANRASAEAARSYAAQLFPGGGATWFEELHALDYQVYAFLQLGRDDEAKRALETLYAIKAIKPEGDMPAAYASGAVPARIALERQDWKQAAALPLRGEIEWAKFPFAEAHVEWAHAIGRVRSNDLAGARAAADRLAQLAAKTPKADPRTEYFAKHILVEERAARALIALAEGKDALKDLRGAADEEDVLGKHPVSPGPLHPIRELYGEALLERGRAAEALEAFEASLRISPNRLHAMAGAARAAEKAGKPEVAAKHWSAIATQAKDSARPVVAEARGKLKK